MLVARRYLTRAIFPFYIVHQTIIVLTGHLLTPLNPDPAYEFVLIFSATVAECFLAFELARRVPLFGLLLGVQPEEKLAQSNQASPVAA